MLLAGLGSVRIGKNCDLGLENAALGLGQHFQDLSRPITYIYFIVIGWEQPNLSLLFKNVNCSAVQITMQINAREFGIFSVIQEND